MITVFYPSAFLNTCIGGGCMWNRLHNELSKLKKDINTDDYYDELLGWKQAGAND